MPRKLALHPWYPPLVALRHLSLSKPGGGHVKIEGELNPQKQSPQDKFRVSIFTRDKQKKMSFGKTNAKF